MNRFLSVHRKQKWLLGVISQPWTRKGPRIVFMSEDMLLQGSLSVYFPSASCISSGWWLDWECLSSQMSQPRAQSFSVTGGCTQVTAAWHAASWGQQGERSNCFAIWLSCLLFLTKHGGNSTAHFCPSVSVSLPSSELCSSCHPCDHTHTAGSGMTLP